MAPGRGKGQGTLAEARLDRIHIPNTGLGAPDRAGIWIREDAAGHLSLSDSRIVSIRNDSPASTIARED
ncbi:MAG: hypothetical protein ACREIA_23180 [Opitutaceae bacterium]